MADTESRIEASCDVLKELLVSKNKNYADAAFKENIFMQNLDAKFFITARISDKIQRIKSLMHNLDNNPTSVELQGAFEDALLDTAGYFLLWRVHFIQSKNRDV